MADKQNPFSPEEVKRLIQGLKESLASLKEILVKIIAILITMGEGLLARFSRARNNAQRLKTTKQEASQVSKPKPELENKKSLEQPIPHQQPSMNRPIMNLLYPFFAGVSTIALVAGVAKLSPISEWAKTQNECIEKTSGLYVLDKEFPDVSRKVKLCNGGHD